MEGYPNTLIPPDGKILNTYLPVELLSDIFLYSIESNQTKSGQLASVCRYWRSVITAMPSLWSTLRVGTWTEREQVTTWLQRAYPKKVVIETQSDIQGPSNSAPFDALLNAIASTGQWKELTISSFPPEILASRLGFQTASPMGMLEVLHVAAGCVYSSAFAHLLNLVPSSAPLSELRLYPAFASTHFLQPQWFPVLQNLTVLIINGRGICEPFGLLPAFTRLQIFEADHLPFPWYEPDANLPLLCTLRRLQVKASSVQWIAGRVFPCLEECVILIPRCWVAVQQLGVHLPSCRKSTYHGYPMDVIQYFHVPQMRAIDLRSHDSKEYRSYHQLHNLCRLNGSISNLTALHLRLQCSEQAFVKVLRYFGPLEELILSIAHPSSSWQGFLQSLTAKPSTKDWPEWCSINPRDLQHQWNQWHQWCSSRTWQANVLLHLKYLGIQCSKGFSQSECLGNSPLFRLVAWSRAQSSSPLEHLKVWEGRGTTDDIVVDYISSGYLEKHLGTSNEKYDSMIVRGMVTEIFVIDHFNHPSFHQLHLTALFRQLQALTICKESDIEIWILPDLEQIKKIAIWHGIIPSYALNIELPLVHTLQCLYLSHSSFSWMHGRTFKVLEECTLLRLRKGIEVPGYKELQVDLPACRQLAWESGYETPTPFFACPTLQSLQWEQFKHDHTVFDVALKSLRNVLLNSSCLQKLGIRSSHCPELNSLIKFVFCDSLEQGAWKNIRGAEIQVHCYPNRKREQFFDQMVEHQQRYKKGWKDFVVRESSTSLYYVNLTGLR